MGRVLGAIFVGAVLVVVFNLATHLVLFMPPAIGWVWVGAVGAFFYWLHARRRNARRPSDLAALIRLRPFRASTGWLLLSVGSTLLVLFGIAGFIDLITGPVDLSEERYYEAIIRYTEPLGGWLAFTFAVAVVMPMIEEFSFRGRIQRVLEWKLGPPAGVFTTSVLFALMHMGGPHAAFLLIPFALGLFAGSAVYLTGSIWAGVLLHGIWNGTIAILSRFSSDPSSTFGEQPPALVALLAAAAVVAGGVGWFRLLRAGRSRSRFAEPAGEKRSDASG